MASSKFLLFHLILVTFLTILHINSRITVCCANCNGLFGFSEKRFSIPLPKYLLMIDRMEISFFAEKLL